MHHWFRRDYTRGMEQTRSFARGSDHGRASIGIVYTGGTFGMVESGCGYVPSTDLPERARSALYEAGSGDLPGVAWLDTGRPPVNSGDIEPRFWFDLAAVIAAARDAHDGFVVIHGTDTLAFTASALSFLLPGLGKPVVVTGAAKPLGETGNDALDNLCHALRVAASAECDEVTVAFGDHLLRGNRATKRHGTAENAFSSPCLPPLAELGADIRWRRTDSPPEVGEADLPLACWRDTRVALVPVYPGIGGDTIRALRDTGVGGLVLEAYSASVGPGGNADFVAAIAECVRAGIVVGAVSQGRQGYIRLGKYAPSTPLAEAGLVGGADMTREAALAKLHVLLAQGKDPERIAAAFGENLRGELTPGK